MKRANDLLVGGVVLGVIAALVSGIVWVKQSDIGRRQREVVAHFRDVGNARVGNSVVVRGVVGGRIQGIELAPNGWVDVRMKLDPSVRLPGDPVVLLNESSLFGDWQATIIERRALPNDVTLAREVADASHESDVLPGATLPGIGKLTAVAGQIAGDVASVASRVGTAFDDSAARDLRSSIRNVADLSATLRGVAEAHATDLDTLGVQLREAVRTLNRTSSVVEVTARRLDSATTSADVRELVANFSTAAFELRHAASQVRELTTRLRVTQTRAESCLASGDSVLSKMNRGQGTLGLLLNDPSVYARADSALLELRALSADIRANPKRYLSVRLF
jgi:phospholipid/cholesterol/gamma-HCH transport system substrate-binding protein